MRVLAIATTCAILFAAPAFAAGGSGNAEQSNQPTAQTGQTTGGPRDDMKGMTTGTVTAPADTGRMSPGTGAAESAKGGNANQNDKPVGNTGTSSGGPAH